MLCAQGPWVYRVLDFEAQAKDFAVGQGPSYGQIAVEMVWSWLVGLAVALAPSTAECPSLWYGRCDQLAASDDLSSAAVHGVREEVLCGEAAPAETWSGSLVEAVVPVHMRAPQPAAPPADGSTRQSFLVGLNPTLAEWARLLEWWTASPCSVFVTAGCAILSRLTATNSAALRQLLVHHRLLACVADVVLDVQHSASARAKLLASRLLADVQAASGWSALDAVPEAAATIGEVGQLHFADRSRVQEAACACSVTATSRRAHALALATSTLAQAARPPTDHRLHPKWFCLHEMSFVMRALQFTSER